MLAALQPTPGSLSPPSSHQATAGNQATPQQNKRTASTPMTRPNSASSQRAPRRSSSSRMKAEHDTTMQPGGQEGGAATRTGACRMLEGCRGKSERMHSRLARGSGLLQSSRRNASSADFIASRRPCKSQLHMPMCVVSQRILPAHSLTCPQRQRAVGQHVERLRTAHRLLHNKFFFFCMGSTAQQAAEWGEGGACC